MSRSFWIARVVGRRARDVVQQTVDELDRWRVDERGLAAVDEALELAIRLTDQAFQRHRRFEAAHADRGEHRGQHGPKLLTGSVPAARSSPVLTRSSSSK